MSASLDLKSKEEKDAELDKRIEALRRKNRALIQRYQEIEEDRKRAEREGIAVTGARRTRTGEGELLEKRRAEVHPPSLTVQVLLSPEEKRLVSSERKFPVPGRTSSSSSSPHGSGRGGVPQGGRPPRTARPSEQPSWEEQGPDSPGGGKRGRGGRGRRPRGRRGAAGDPGPDRRSKEWEERRRENIEKMNEEMEKIAEYERSQRDGLQEKNPVRNFLDDPRRSGSFTESDRREGSRRHIRNWGGADFDKVKMGAEPGKERPSPGRGNSRRSRPPDLDMTLSMTGRERAEYLRWKQEREQIDRERLERHRQPTGEWRREWDAEKMDAVLKEGGKCRGSESSKQDESRRPPKPPTFGEYLPGLQPERRRWKSRGRQGGRQGGPSKPYSMHDIRWEPEELEPEAAVAEKEKLDRGPPAQQSGPLISASPGSAVEEEEEEEEEDEWEDVSEGEEQEEEEEEAAAASSQGSLVEETAAAATAAATSPAVGPGQGVQPLPAAPALATETPNPEGKPLSPFQPAEGYHPVPDWGEEMELSSPRADSVQSPVATAEEAPPAQQGVAAKQALPLAPGAVEITDLQQEQPGA